MIENHFGCVCPGSGYISSPMTQSVLCYCGQIFRRRLKSLKKWAVPEHESKVNKRIDE